MAHFTKVKSNKYFVRKNGALGTRNADVSKSDIVSVTSAKTLTTQDSGSTIVFNNAAGFTVTLPAATGSGNKYKFIVGTTVTSVADKIICSAATEYFAGVIFGAADAGNTVNGWEAASTSDYISLNGSTTGGLIGDQIDIIDIATGVWAVKGFISQTGTEATPFGST